MSYKISNDTIRVFSENTSSFIGKTVAIILIIVAIAFGCATLANINEFGSFFCGLFFTFCVLYLAHFMFFHKERIWVDRYAVSFGLAKTKETVKYSSISKAEISADNCLIMYNKSGDIHITADLEHFQNKELQLLVNYLCKKVALSLDSEFARERGIVLPQYAIAEQISITPTRKNDENRSYTEQQNTGTGRRRIVLSEGKSDFQTEDKPDNNTKPRKGRRLEL